MNYLHSDEEMASAYLTDVYNSLDNGIYKFSGGDVMTCESIVKGLPKGVTILFGGEPTLATEALRLVKNKYETLKNA